MSERSNKEQKPSSKKESGSGSQSSDDPKRKKTSVFRKLAEKVHLVDVTELGPEYKTNTALVKDHRDVMKAVLEACDQLVEPDSARRDKPDPSDCTQYDLMVAALRGLAKESFSDDAKAQTLLETAAQAHHALATEFRRFQVLFNEQTSSYQRFLCKWSDNCDLQLEKLKSCRMAMDYAEAQVRKANSIDKLETLGHVYEQSVKEFEMQADVVTGVFADLQKRKEHHKKGVVKQMEVQAEWHKKAAEILDKAEKTVEGLLDQLRAGNNTNSHKDATPSTPKLTQ